MDTFYDDAALRRRLNHLQAEHPKIAKAVRDAGLDLTDLVALYQKQLKAGLAYSPEDLLEFAIKRHQLASSRPPAA